MAVDVRLPARGAPFLRGAARHPGRAAATALLGLAVAAVLGALAGADPRLALVAVGALVVGALLLTDVTWALVTFIVIQFVVSALEISQDAIKGAGAVVVGVWILSQAVFPERRAAGLAARQPLLTAALVLFVVWGAMSLLWATNPAAVSTDLQRMVMNMALVGIVFSAVKTRRDVEWTVAAIAGGLLLAAGLLITLYGGNEQRLEGGEIDSNKLAAALVPGLLLSGVLATSGQNTLKRLAFGVGALVGVVALLMTLSRGGLISMGVALVVLAVYGGRYRVKVLVSLLLIATAAVLYFGLVVDADSRERVTSFGTGAREENDTGRPDIWKVGVEAFRDKPVLGAGFGNYIHEAPLHLFDAGYVRRSDLIIVTPLPAHNMYLHVLVESGLVGFALFAVILTLPLVAGVKAVRRFEAAGDRRMELLGRVYVAGTVGLLAADFFLSGQYDRILWLLLGLGPALLALSERPAPELRPA